MMAVRHNAAIPASRSGRGVDSLRFRNVCMFACMRAKLAEGSLILCSKKEEGADEQKQKETKSRGGGSLSLRLSDDSMLTP
mmetsp:Transcript_91790/g.191918  ORF Transcript_91790/g.191918 Transcript_91790/m.191918 type:complete len:81 (+) Transcript_91790:129-371(+)